MNSLVIDDGLAIITLEVGEDFRRAEIDADHWNAVAANAFRCLNEARRANKQPLLKPPNLIYRNKQPDAIFPIERHEARELGLLAIALDGAALSKSPDICSRWAGLHPIERRWLYTQAYAEPESCWLGALRYALGGVVPYEAQP